MLSRSIVIVLWLAAGAAGVLAATFSVTVKVVDAQGEPVPKADVAVFWDVKGAMTPRGKGGAVTDETGKTVLQVDDWDENRPVLVLSADRKLGGVAGISRTNDGKQVSITLGPTVRLKGRLVCTELNSKPAWANTMITPDGFRPHFAQRTGESEFEFVLPAGKYALRSYGADVEDIKQTVTLTRDQSEYDLGTLDMKASPIAKLKGKTAPGWDITAARGVKPNAKLADYKRKWIYLEFWGFW